LSEVFGAFLNVFQSLTGSQLKAGGFEAPTAFMCVAFKCVAKQSAKRSEVPDV
jgi:hypothetical protein